MLLECFESFLAGRDLARLARLRRPDDAAHDVLPNDDTAGNEVDILPTQRERRVNCAR